MKSYPPPSTSPLWRLLPLGILLASPIGAACGPGTSGDPETPTPSADTTPTPSSTPTQEATPTSTATEAPPTSTPMATPSAGPTPTEGATTFTLTSPTLVEGGSLPTANACERDGGGGMSPPLTWSGAPADTAGFALTMHHFPSNSDPEVDTPNSYWLLWNIPAATAGLSEDNTESVGTEGGDKDGVSTGYTPPCSPGDEVHSYTITLFALSGAPQSLGSEDTVAVDYETLKEAIAPLTLGSAAITFTN